MRGFTYNNGLLYRVFIDDSKREVPRPAEKTDIVKKSHDDGGHFGIEQTTSLVDTEYSWHVMYKQVRLYVRRRHSCAKANASFVPRDVMLPPLPIMGMFYR